ncbi:MAG: AAA family ATPase [Paramuribaculum sp.]|nr:AAA family ATPase [Paramuribaculum sp.]
MSNSKFLKKLTAAEVGNTRTHEVYIRIPNDFDFESFFNNSHVENGSVVEVTFNAVVSTKIIDNIAPQTYDLRFVYFANSNKEKRIPGLGPLFKAFKVEEGDVICLEKDEDNSFFLTFLSPDTVQIYNGGLLLNGNLEESPVKDVTRADDKLPRQVIYYGAPGTGKSFTIDDITDDDNSVRTTFHPDSDYASFVGAYKPTMENVPINSIYGESVQFATGKNGHPGTEKKIVYKYVPQAFLKAYVAAWSNLDKPYFLIIEEINRGNCAQIFGDLFQLLDRNNAGSSSYAIHADEDITQFLSSDTKGFANLSEEQKNFIRDFKLQKDNGKIQAIGKDILDGKLLLLPPNLYIWATMNTSDQSLFPIDSAFKRRWNWKYMPIEYNPLDQKTQQPIDWKFQIGDNLYSWGQFLSVMNPEILTLTESSDKQMGYFFAKADHATGIISEEVFLNKVLFYLWTDVFKDFDVSSELFKNKEKNRSFIFTDFFDKEQPNTLANFIDNLNLDVVEDIEHVGEIQNEKGEWVQPTFEVEGETIASMIDTVLTVLKLYFEKYPDISTDKAIEEWNSFGMPKHALETEEVFNERTDSSKNRASKIFYTPDGRKFYVSAQLRKQHMDKLISKASDWGINITRIL